MSEVIMVPLSLADCGAIVVSLYETSEGYRRYGDVGSQQICLRISDNIIACLPGSEAKQLRALRP